MIWILLLLCTVFVLLIGALIGYRLAWIDSHRIPPLPRVELADELDKTSDRLRGWTLTGTGGPDLNDLLGEASAALRSYARRLPE